MAPGAEPAVWWGWGSAERHRPLDPAALEMLRAGLGIEAAASSPRPALDAVRVGPSRLPGAARAALAAAVGAAHVLEDHGTRVRHAGGRSTVDLLRLRAGDASTAPDAVVRPGGHDEVAAALEACAAFRIAVVPFGGGTSVVGGVAPLRDGLEAVVALDVGRLDRLVDVDPVSLTATLEAGVRAPRAEALLTGHGLTLGHFPQSFELASLGGFAATRSAGQASAGYGRFDDIVERLRVATPSGSLDLGRAPASAAGPDLRQLVLGSEGIFGVITELGLRVRRSPAVRRDEAWRFADLASGVDGLRRLAQEDAGLPAILRLGDEIETAVLGALDGGVGGASAGGCLAVAGFEGDAAGVERRRAIAAEVLSAAGAEPLGAGPGEAWRRGRFEAPYMRDALLDAGVLVETLETATSWSSLLRLHAGLGAAIGAALGAEGARGLVLAHVSHVYPSGASLYVTVATAQGPDPVARWGRIKAAASRAIVAAGATISHHHGVGTDHRAAMAAEVGGLGVELIRAVKRRLDPVGILNPGKLIPATGEAAGAAR